MAIDAHDAAHARNQRLATTRNKCIATAAVLRKYRSLNLQFGRRPRHTSSPSRVEMARGSRTSVAVASVAIWALQITLGECVSVPPPACAQRPRAAVPACSCSPPCLSLSLKGMEQRQRKWPAPWRHKALRCPRGCVGCPTLDASSRRAIDESCVGAHRRRAASRVQTEHKRSVRARPS